MSSSPSTVLADRPAIADASCKSRFCLIQMLCRKAVFSLFDKLQVGRLIVREGESEFLFGDHQADLKAEIRVLDREFYQCLIMGGSIGAGEAYMQELWTSRDLTTVIRLFVRNRAVLDGMEKGLARAGRLLPRIMQALHRNTRVGSRKNIVAHYDLSDDFFRLFLDPTMMYSAAIFDRPEMSLEEASLTKMDRICQKLRLNPDDHLLEIGSGWGSMAIHAARYYGCRVTTTTISDNQYETCLRRIQDAGLAHRITVLKKDYRDLDGTYSKLVSIEMIEAVGWQYYDTFFATCSRLLRPDGLMLIQAITIDDRQFEKAKRSVDFIQRYIFPGSNIPSLAALSRSVSHASDFRLTHLEDLSPHYAITLRCWHHAFRHRLKTVRELGFSETFIRMWEFYLCYCEGGFVERLIGSAQLLYAKPLNRSQPLLGNLAMLDQAPNAGPASRNLNPTLVMPDRDTPHD